ncbi:MAG TPA: hypothetical protein PLS58_04780 [Bacteroidales bacterium]|nr:hypothetical protein [Bacteroidales bacterium]
MKTAFSRIRIIMFRIICAVSLFFFLTAGIGINAGEPVSNNTLTIYCPTGLDQLVDLWAKEYSSHNPGFRYSISVGDMGRPAGSGSLGFYPEKTAEMDPAGEGFRMVVGQSAVIAVFNAANPSADAIMQKGIPAEKIAGLFSGSHRWSDIIKGGHNAEVKLFITDNAESAGSLGSICRKNISERQGIESLEAAAVIRAVENNRDAIGFCQLNDVIAAGVSGTNGNIRFMPVDKNSNGRIDGFEDIYANTEELARGIWIGKYPKALCSNICAVAAEKTPGETIIAFLSWIMNDGGRYLAAFGFSELPGFGKESNMAILAGTGQTASVAAKHSGSGLWILLLSLVALSGVFLIMVFGARRRTRILIPSGATVSDRPFTDTAVNVLKGIYYDRSHTWSFMEKDGSVRIGIDDFLQHVTGDLTKVRLREHGEHVRRGEKIFSLVRNGKQIDIHSPVSGIIKEKNISLGEDSSSINRSPYGDGWVYLIEPVNWEKEIRYMFMAEKYREWIRDEISRLKDFLAASFVQHKLAYAHAVLQDGGELTDNVLAELEPEIWEDFQRNFLDKTA